MNKILKITIVVLSLVSVLAMSVLTVSAEGSNTYGYVTYNPVTSDGVVKDKMNMPIIIDPLLEYYGTSSSRRFQTYNFSGKFARWRIILPDIGAKAFVSSSKNVRLNIGVQYTRQLLFNSVNSVNVPIFTLPAVYDSSGGIVNDAGVVFVWVYRYNSSEDIYSMQRYEFTLDSNLQLTLSSLGISFDDYSDTFGFAIDWLLDSSLDGSDLTVSLPLNYSPLVIDEGYISQNEYDFGYDVGYDEGYDAGYEYGQDWSSDPVGIIALVSAVSSFLALEIIPGVPFAIIIECFLALAFIMIVSKLIAGG